MISIVIPVYNVEKYLDECLSSVMNIRSEFEILLVNDGSTDSSGEICDKWALKDQRIKVIHKENGGLSSARNAGILNSQGEYVMFLDSDDFLDAGETDAILKYIDAKADVLVGFYRNYYTESEKYEKEQCELAVNKNGIVEIGQFLKMVPKDGQSFYMIACRYIVQREFLLKNNLLFFEGIYHEDEEWTQRLICSANRIGVYNHFFYQYRQAREGAITSRVRYKNVEDRFSIMRKTRILLQNSNIGDEKKEYLRYRMAQLYLSNMIDCNQFTKEEKKKIQNELCLFKKECNEYMCGKIGTMARICQNILGTRMTCLGLAFARKILKKK